MRFENTSLKVTIKHLVKLVKIAVRNSKIFVVDANYQKKLFLKKKYQNGLNFDVRDILSF